MVWHGKTYFGTKVPAVVQLGQPLGGGTIPGCNDGGGPTPDEAVKLAAIESVATAEAIAISGDRSTVYVEPSYFTQVPRTPLHDVLFGPSETKPNERGECEPGQTTKASVRAVVRGASFGMLTVTLLDTTALPRKNWIFPDAQTAIEGGGTPPRVSTGDVVRAQVLVCRHSDNPHFLKLVATRLTLPSAAS